MNIISKRQRCWAFTFLELFATIVVVGIIVLLVVLALLPAPRHHGAPASRINCVNNLKQVNLAFRLWAGDNGDRYPMRCYTNAQGGPLFMDATNVYCCFQIMSNELNTPKVVVCPA